MDTYNILWFRHGLRFHDNSALVEAIKSDSPNEIIHLIPIFIFDGESAGTNVVGYNRMKFLLESLDDLNQQFRALGGRLYMFEGDPVAIFQRLWEEFGIKKICFEQDCEPIWKERDSRVFEFCRYNAIQCIEKIGHTLWNPNEIIDSNGGYAPLTYSMFLHTVDAIGPPPLPVPSPEWTNVKIAKIPGISMDLKMYEQVPLPKQFELYSDMDSTVSTNRWHGGEREALALLEARLKTEGDAFKNGFYLPNQSRPDIINFSTSLSAALRFGCLSVRKFYWDIHDLFYEVKQCHPIKNPGGHHITGQLFWREYFYTMSVRNPQYAVMEGNPICLNIPWREANDGMFERWKDGKTGFPIIDAAMRQLLAEGWIHHTLRTITATFLTRGALWISWEKGLQHFLKYLLDADWSVCAGNWMWVSSSAFETLLDSSHCTCPVVFGKRLDPNGEYIRRYIPELRNYPREYIHEPWKAPMELQQQCEHIIGIHYPQPMIDFKMESNKNRKAMSTIREAILKDTLVEPQHCRPSNEEEIRNFFWFLGDIKEPNVY